MTAERKPVTPEELAQLPLAQEILLQARDGKLFSTVGLLLKYRSQVRAEAFMEAAQECIHFEDTCELERLASEEKPHAE